MQKTVLQKANTTYHPENTFPAVRYGSGRIMAGQFYLYSSLLTTGYFKGLYLIV